MSRRRDELAIGLGCMETQSYKKIMKDSIVITKALITIVRALQLGKGGNELMDYVSNLDKYIASGRGEYMLMVRLGEYEAKVAKEWNDLKA